MDGGGGDQEPLVGADVGGRLAAADVLLAGLQRQGIARLAVEVDGAPDDAPGHLPHQVLLAAQEAGVGPARGHGDTQGLGVAAGDVCPAVAAPLAGRLQQCQGHRVDHGDDQGIARLGPIRQGVHVLQHTEEVGLGHHHGGKFALGRVQHRHRGVAAVEVEPDLHHLDPLGLDDGAQRAPVARVQGTRHQHTLGLHLAVGAHRHQHRLGQGRASVVEGGVGDVHAGQRRHHRLEFVEQLQGPLTGLRLVGGVGAVELAAGGDLPHRRGDVVLVGPGADEAQGLAIGAGARLHQPGDVHLRQRRGDAGQLADLELAWDFVEQVIDAGGPDDLEHGADVVFGVGGERHGSVPGRGRREDRRPKCCARRWGRMSGLQPSASSTAW